jgi:alkanesulfonate monooxygenase SsuD/methylene tetrahydromethanopterin reductase-like flavin-dependent oxidoreductase (luciferase family)
MHVGYSVAFQNPEDGQSDEAVYAAELALLDEAVDLGFDSIWTVEHHFTDYTMCPDPVQFLTWVAARHPHVRLGTGVIVLPWHDPLRCAEQIAVLDNLSDGRLILGIGRGLARIEYEGFRVDMNSSRERFTTYAEMIIEGLEQGYLEGRNEFVDQPRRDLRPAPRFSFRGRTYAAAVSPESMPIMARLGVGLLVIPQKPWEVVRKDFADYHQVWTDVHGADVPPPAPLCGGFAIVHEDAERAEELAYRYIGGYYGTVLKHYEFGADPHQGVKGYEFYTNITKYIGRHGAEGAIKDFVGLMPWGTPDQVVEKLQHIRDTIGMAGFNPNFSFAGMPVEESRRSLQLFAREVLPELKTWDTEPLAPVERRAARVGAPA